ncbi:MAG: SDR family NAD(P)-dependent oxidoreductase [Desulfovibrio sp.]|nr:SDR family NAD(P)-dependent oxidoreductase [Desulfovibrio sp.]
MSTIFITGASSGIGKASARYFAEKGWQVIATMRKPEKEKELVALDHVRLMPLDVTDSAQIVETCRKALAEFDVDVLLNNAGYGIMAPLEKPTEAEIRRLFDTDVIGSMLVTQQFIPHFKQRRAGVIMVTTSLAAIIAFPRDAVYGAAKRAQQGMVESLYYEMRPFGVAVKAMLPGGTKTNFQTPLNDTTSYEKAAANQRRFLLDGNEEFPGPEEAAEIIYRAATDGRDIINYPTDSVCAKLYAQYEEMGLEKFKDYFYRLVFENQA